VDGFGASGGGLSRYCVGFEVLGGVMSITPGFVEDSIPDAVPILDDVPLRRITPGFAFGDVGDTKGVVGLELSLISHVGCSHGGGLSLESCELGKLKEHRNRELMDDDVSGDNVSGAGLSLSPAGGGFSLPAGGGFNLLPSILDVEGAGFSLSPETPYCILSLSSNVLLRLFITICFWVNCLPFLFALYFRCGSGIKCS